MCMPTQIQLKPVKMVKIGPESAVRVGLPDADRGQDRVRRDLHIRPGALHHRGRAPHGGCTVTVRRRGPPRRLQRRVVRLASVDVGGGDGGARNQPGA